MTKKYELLQYYVCVCVCQLQMSKETNMKRNMFVTTNKNILIFFMAKITGSDGYCNRKGLFSARLGISFEKEIWFDLYKESLVCF